MSRGVAVVVGVCAHGLAIARSLRAAGVRVVALEANGELPGTRTGVAEVRLVPDINGPGLVDALVELSRSLLNSDRPVLFLTNDTMVRTVGTRVSEVTAHYRLSWASDAASVLKLLEKQGIREHCRDRSLPQPRTQVIRTYEELAHCCGGQLALPVILKPSRPISSYKTLVIRDRSELREAWDRAKQSLPAIAQEYIEGDDSQIVFAAMYLVDGKPLVRFEGRKLRSRPMGHTSIALSESNDGMHAFARHFFEGLSISGPVSLEAKMDSSGTLWIIEPTVGRTDFWVGLCIDDGADLPVAEYLHQTGEVVPQRRQRDRTLWINGERDGAALVWLTWRYPAELLRRRVVGVFLKAGDIRPFVAWLGLKGRELPSRVKRKISGLARWQGRTRHRRTDS